MERRHSSHLQTCTYTLPTTVANVLSYFPSYAPIIFVQHTFSRYFVSPFERSSFEPPQLSLCSANDSFSAPARSPNMASRKKVLLKVYLLVPRNLRHANRAPQVIILGDSGVGKTSLMNQYVRSSSRSVAIWMASGFFGC